MSSDAMMPGEAPATKPSSSADEVPLEAIEAFVLRWSASDADEQANSQPFLSELCDIIGVPRPNVATAEGRDDNYAFEKRVAVTYKGERQTVRKIDLYKRGCFVLEAKQGRNPDRGHGRFDEKPVVTKAGTAVRGTPGYRDAMERAYQQARDYARALPTEEGWPPFLIVVDIGHSFELFSDFARSGKDWLPFPNAQHSRIRLEDLRRSEIRERLRQVWMEPLSLDPAAHAAKVTRHVAERLALLARSLEEDGHRTDVAAHFLMRCLFCMFAEDANLLEEGTFTDLLREARADPSLFVDLMESLFNDMNVGGFSAALRKKIRRFNGGLFAQVEGEPAALPLDTEQLELLIEAAETDWTEVEPAIFGTLLERALNPKDRHKLGAHYTPREYVERLVMPTVIEPLRTHWDAARAAASQLDNEGDTRGAVEVVRRFHRQLCEVRVLDPACGSGNFLYVTLEHMKRLEGEILRHLEDLDQNQYALELAGFRVNPSQFLGIELNPRAAAVADLVLWIGYLQWQLTTDRAGGIPDPVLQAFGNIECRDAVLAYDEERPKLDATGSPVTVWDRETMKRHPVTGDLVPDESAQIQVWEYVGPRRAEWPEADIVVGNPPFLGNSRMRGAFGDGYAEALRTTYPEVPESAEFVMYWWEKAAQLVREGRLRRFGFITTNSITQTFARRVVARHLDADPPLALQFAIPDHPWIDSADGAAVRVAMTVGAGDGQEGHRLMVVAETSRADGSSDVQLAETRGPIRANLRVGVDTTRMQPLRANDGLSSPGVKLHGSGFIVKPEQAAELGLGRIEGLERHIRHYRNGRDINQLPRGVMVIDLFGLSADEVRDQYPDLYQWIVDRVKPERDQNRRATYRDNWWIFGEPRRNLRPVLDGLTRYIATVETSKHRFFVFLDESILPDNMLVCIGLDDAFHMGVLSSRVHVVYALDAGGRLGVGNDPRYNKTRCFDPFPFPDAPEAIREKIRALAESLDAHRKKRQALHPKLRLTNVYNVLEALREGRELTEKERTIYEQGAVGVLRELHDELDAAVSEAYGWPHELEDEEILERLVALNEERAAEEEGGLVRWLRPRFQNPDGAASGPHQAVITKAVGAPKTAETTPSEKREWPKTLPDRMQAVREVLEAADAVLDVEAVAGHFKRARRQDVATIIETLERLGLAGTLGLDEQV